MASLTDIGVIQLDEDVKERYENIDPNGNQHDPSHMTGLLSSSEEVPRPFFGVLDVVDFPSEMDGREGEDLKGEHFAGGGVGGVPPVGALSEEAVVDPCCGCAVPD